MSADAPPPNDKIDDPESVEEESTGHPLFARAYTETGPDHRRFDWIQVVRYLPDGTREVCPKMFKGSELRSWQQILDEYGGECTYQLGAQTAHGHRFTAWSEKCFFASPPRKSFYGGPWTPKQDSAITPTVVPQQTTQDALLIALVKLLADRRDPPPPPPPPNPVEMLREAAALLNGGNRGPSQFEMFKEMLPLMNSGERTSRTLMQGIELARELYKNAPAAAPARSSGEDLGDIMGLVKMFTAVRPANPPAPAAPAPAPNPPQQQMQNAFAPPCAPPPGYGWMYTQQGWVAFPVAMANHTPFANRPAPAPTPPAQAPAAPAQIDDEDALLRKLLEHPETRAKLQALLATPNAAPPVPTAAPSAPVPAPQAAPTPAPVQAPPGAAQTPAHTLSDLLAASGWSATPAGAAPALHYTKPSEPPAAAVSPAEPPPAQSFEIPADVPLDDEMRALLAEPGFCEIASAVIPPEAQGAFATLVQKNALQLQAMPEA